MLCKFLSQSFATVRCFPVNFAKFLRTSFLTEHLQWLLLFRVNRVSDHYARSIYIKVFLCIIVPWALEPEKNTQNQQKHQHIRSKIPTINAVQDFRPELHLQFHFPGFFLYIKNTYFQKHLRELFDVRSACDEMFKLSQQWLKVGERCMEVY